MPSNPAPTNSNRLKETRVKTNEKTHYYGKKNTPVRSNLQLELEIEKGSTLLEGFGNQPAFLIDEYFTVIALTTSAAEILGNDFQQGAPLFESSSIDPDQLTVLTSEIRTLLTEDEPQSPRFLKLNFPSSGTDQTFCATLQQMKLSRERIAVSCLLESVLPVANEKPSPAVTKHDPSHFVSWSLDLEEQVFEIYDEPSNASANRKVKLSDWLGQIHKTDRERVSRSFKALISGNSNTINLRYQLSLPEGKSRSISTIARVTPTTDDSQPKQAIGFHNHEPELQNVVDDLKLFSHLARKVQLSIIVYDADGYVNWCNNAFTDATGYAFDEVIGRDPIALLRGPLTDLETVKYIRDRLRKGKAVHAELVQYKKSGIPYWVRIDGTPLEDENGKVNRFISFQTDITESKKTQSAILRNEIKFRSLFDHSNDALLLVSPRDGIIVEANRASIQLLDTDRLVGQRLEEVFPDNPFFTIKHFNEIVDDSDASRRESSEVVTAEGSIKPVELSVSQTPIGESMALFVSIRDISEVRQLEEQLRHTQRMEAVGRLAGGIAHDFNNLLAGQRGFSELLCNSKELCERDHAYATEILKITDRASKLTSRLLSFSRGKSEKPVVANLNEIVENLMPMLSRILKKDVRFTSDLDADLCNVKVDTNQIDQVVMNLVVNGQEAITNHEGVVSLTTETVDLRGNEIFITGKAKPGRYAKIAVEDNGQGIPRDVLEKIFEPFFTTKKGAGTGLGLSIVYGIIVSNGGHLSVDSQVGRGTQFAFYFPEVDEEVKREQTPDHRATMPAASPSESGSAPTVLIAEDQEQVREILELGLGQSGYNLIVAKDGMEAIEKGKAHEGKIDLLLTDSIMPRASGVKVIKELREAYPDIKVILVSGLPQQESEDCKNLQVDAYVDKPFSIRNLLEQINEIVGVSK